MKYYDETNSAAMSEDDDAVDIESDVSVRTRFGGANRLFREVRVISSECALKFSLLWIFQDGDDLSADGKSRSANNQYFSQVISIFASTGAARGILGHILRLHRGHPFHIQTNLAHTKYFFFRSFVLE